MRQALALLTISAVLLVSCKEQVAAVSDELNVAQAEALMASAPDLQIIDVRSPGEHKNGYLKGAKLIPIDEFEKRYAEVSKDKPVLLYCAGGGRSAMALDILKNNGYTQASHLMPGFDGWRDAKKPYEK